MAYSQATADAICTRLENGESLRSICADESMPDRETVRRWMDAHPEFAAKCARAREEQAEFHHAEMDRIEAGVLDGSIQAQAANVVLSNKRWRMEKLKPKVYGQKVTNEHTGPDGGPLQLADSTNEAIDARIQALLGQP